MNNVLIVVETSTWWYSMAHAMAWTRH